MKREILSYTDLKAIILKKNLSWQYKEHSNRYRIFAIDTGVCYETTVYFADPGVGGIDTTQHAADKTNFDDNYKAAANFAIGERTYAFSTPDFQFNGDGVLATATKNTTTNIDFAIPGAAGTFHYINGATAMTKDAVFGDWVSAVIIDKDNLLGYGANTVLANYVTKWYLNPAQEFKLETPYAGKLMAGLYIRSTYHSVGTVTDPQMAINYLLHTPL